MARFFLLERIEWNYVMKTHEQNPLHMHTIQGPDSPKQRGGNSLLTSLGAVLVVVVLIALSVTVFTVWRAGKGPGNAPPQGTWKTVLNGYVVSSLVAAHDKPAVIYVCASYTGNTNVVSSDVSYTISRSADFGNTWQTSQESGKDVALKGFCQLAINPSDSNDVYVVGGVASAQNGTIMVLKHSTDGGKTWETIQPMLHYPVPGPAIAPIGWQVRQITVVGNTLFGLQWIGDQAGPPQVGGVRSGPSLPTAYYAMPRLTVSTDGGHNWSVIDKNISTLPQGVRSFAVDPTNAQTIYALLDTSQWPMGAMNGAPNDREPASYGVNGTLYKTTNGGNTWTPILKNLRYGTQVQLASGNPKVLYVGGLNLPMPLGAQPATGVDQGQGTTPANPANRTASYGFHLQVSQDGGASWHEVATSPAQVSIQSWFVGADGLVYAAANPAYPSGPNGTPQPTPIMGTVVPVGTTSVNGVQRTVQGVQGQASTAARSSTPAPKTGTVMNVLRYDPANPSSWQPVTSYSLPGSLLMVTPGSGNSGVVLWLTGVENGKAVLSRYVA